MAVIEVSAGNVLAFANVLTTNIKILNVTSALSLVQNQTETPAARDTVSTLTLSHIARTTYGLHTVSVASFLNVTQYTHPKSASLSVSNYLALSQVGAHPFFENPTNALVLSQSVQGERALHLPHTLNLVQVVGLRHVRSESLTHSLNLQSLVAYYLVNRSFFILATPLPPPVAPVSSIPTGPVSHPRYLIYFQQGSTSIELPRPEFGNIERFDFNRVNRRSRGGDLILFRNEEWPKTKTLTLTFAWINESQKQRILKFMQDTVGQRVTYLDHYGNNWLGFIMTPAAEVSQESLNNKTFTVDFQGVKQ